MKIFLSYRRSDSQNETNRIARVLKRHFDDTNVVLDTDTFLLGNDFRREIMQHLIGSDVVLVVIGEFWHSTMEDRHANNPSEPDWVIREIETAFQEKKIIIPLFLGDTAMPPTEFLPSSIQELPNRNGMKIRASISEFDDDVQRLIQRIQQSMGIFVKPQPNTKEYLAYLLLNATWKYTASEGNDHYICEQENAYRIVVDIGTDEYEEPYSSEWADNFCGPHRTYPVYVIQNGQTIQKTYFVSIWGAKYFVPLPDIDGTVEKPIYYWDVHSIKLKLARHIAQFHTVYKTLEDFAKQGKIELRE
jgi:hypothetical protein